MGKRIAAALLGFVGLSCGNARPEFAEGGLYATPNENGTFAVLKVLKVDDGGVHVRLYSNKFAEFPSSLDESSLYVAGMDDEGEEFGMGHAPISWSAISTWGARFVQPSSVSQDELDGYRIWLDADGGYF